MRRFAVIAAVGLVLLALGYLASGIGQAGTVAISESSSSVISTTTTVTTSTTTTTTTTTTKPKPVKKTRVCHRTKSKTRPYTLVRVSGKALRTHLRHRLDIIPAPRAGCPKKVVKVRNHKIVKGK